MGIGISAIDLYVPRFTMDGSHWKSGLGTGGRFSRSVASHDEDAGRWVTNTSMHYVETRLDDQFLLALTAKHELKAVDGKLRIANKRVDILNCDAAFGNIQLLP